MPDQDWETPCEKSPDGRHCNHWCDAEECHYCGAAAEAIPDEVCDCPNPFCDGEGNIDVSPSINGRSWALGACKVGPHVSPPVAA